MALVLAWLLISCVAWCTLCTSLNCSESVYSSAKCEYQHTSPLYAHLQQALNGIRPGGKNRHTILVLSVTLQNKGICLIFKNTDNATN